MTHLAISCRFNDVPMQHRHRFRAFLAAIAISSLLVGNWSLGWADEDDKAKSLALRTIMQDMSSNMQAVTAAISREDWEAVATAAPLIADHPQPPLVEKMRILRFVGTNADKFRSHDKKTQQAAQALQQAAARSDGYAVIAAFATLQDSCLACHQSFRKPFVEHFYGQR
jgi:cytochrome c556